MDINVRNIPHEQHRYPTVGDWELLTDGSMLIEVSDMKNEDYQFLVAIHELIEAYLCRKRGITEEAVNAFDINYEANRPQGDTSEPGFDPAAPYFKEHVFATQIERLIADELGVDWDEYDETVCNL